MDAQRKLRNLLSYTKTDSVEELEDCNKLYEELLAHLNKQEKVTELLGLYQTYHYEPSDINQRIKTLEKELGEMK